MATDRVPATKTSRQIQLKSKPWAQLCLPPIAAQRTFALSPLAASTMNTTTNNNGTAPVEQDPPLATAGERPVWSGTPSQLINLPQYLLWGAIFAALVALGSTLWTSMQLNLSPPMRYALYVIAAIPLVIIGWKYLVLANTRYELTTQRLRTRTGVLNKHLELYRVRDYRLEQPFYLRMFALANIRLESSDRSTPSILLRAVPRGERVREDIRTYVEEARRRRGVRDIEVD
jgi:membrane protein YdbS with pleckstrin-like domain